MIYIPRLASRFYRQNADRNARPEPSGLAEMQGKIDRCRMEKARNQPPMHTAMGVFCLAPSFLYDNDLHIEMTLFEMTLFYMTYYAVYKR